MDALVASSKLNKELDKMADIKPSTPTQMLSPSQNQGKSKKMADILTKYFGNELLKNVERFEVNTVDLSSWRTLRLYGIKKNKDSIQKNGVLEINNLWLLGKREDNCMP